MCQYCEGENLTRKPLIYDSNTNPVFIRTNENGDSFLITDFIDNYLDEDSKIKAKFCLICGRNL